MKNLFTFCLLAMVTFATAQITPRFNSYIVIAQSTAPANPVDGQRYFDTEDNVIYQYNSTDATWIPDPTSGTPISQTNFSLLSNSNQTNQSYFVFAEPTANTITASDIVLETDNLEGISPSAANLQATVQSIDDAIQAISFVGTPTFVTVDQELTNADVNTTIINNTTSSINIGITNGIGEIGDVIVFKQAGAGGLIYPYPGTGVTFTATRRTSTAPGSTVIYEKIGDTPDVWLPNYNPDAVFDYIYTPPAPDPGDITIYSGSDISAAQDGLTSDGDFSLTLPSTVDADDILVATASLQGAVDFTTPAGWTLIAETTTVSEDRTVIAYYKVADGSEDAGSISLVSDGTTADAVYIGRVLRFAGVNTSTVLESTTSRENFSTNDILTNSVSSTQDNNVHIDIVSFFENQSTVSTPSNMTELFEDKTFTGADAHIAVYYQLLNNGATQAAQTYTYGGAAYGGATISFVLIAQ